MKKLIIISLILLLVSPAFAEWTIGSWTQTAAKRTSQDVVPTSATTNCIDGSISDYFMVEASCHGVTLVRPLYWSTRINAYLPEEIASSPLIQANPPSAIASSGCVWIRASKAVFIGKTYGNSNIFIQIFGVKNQGASITKGRKNIDLWVAPLQQKEYRP